MGTPDLAKTSLEKLYNSEHEIIAVVTTPDKPKGRGMKLMYSPVKEYALEKQIPIYQPEKVRKNTEFLNTIKELNPDLICVVAYGKILPKTLLEIPRLGCVNVHPSLLPKYRGPAPIQWAVLNGDEQTGVTTMYMDAGMDTGDMILVEKTKIGEEETTGELWDRLAQIGGDLLLETVNKVEDGTAPRIKQSDEYTLAPMLEKEMAKINWEEKTAHQIKNLVRGLNPIMGAFTFLEGKKIKFWKVKDITDDELLTKFPELQEYSYKLNQLTPGTILFSSDKTGLFIKAKQGIVEVLEIQAENAKRMRIQDFLRGNELKAGAVFE